MLLQRRLEGVHESKYAVLENIGRRLTCRLVRGCGHPLFCDGVFQLIRATLQHVDRLERSARNDTYALDALRMRLDLLLTTTLG